MRHHQWPAFWPDGFEARAWPTLIQQPGSAASVAARQANLAKGRDARLTIRGLSHAADERLRTVKAPA